MSNKLKLVYTKLSFSQKWTKHFLYFHVIDQSGWNRNFFVPIGQSNASIKLRECDHFIS